MNTELLFLPDRRRGTIYQGGVMLLLVILGVQGLWQASQARIGPAFLLALLPLAVAAIGLPLLAYRIYALQTAVYTLQRNGIRLRWGLRVEDIPISAVRWVHPAEELESQLTYPWLRWPGAVLGLHQVPGLGPVEFLASRTQRLVCIGTEARTFAISPVDPQAFAYHYQRLIELGSFSPLVAHSAYPGTLLRQVWASRLARFLLISGFLLSLALLVWASLAIPARLEFHLGFEPDGSPGDLVPAVQLLLLPVLNATFFAIDLFLGLFFFRRASSQTLAYLTWGMGALLPLLFIVGVFFILQAG